MPTQEQNEANPGFLAEQEQAYQAYALALRKDCQPDSAIEEEAFERYAWASFQAKRARKLELLAESRSCSNPGDASLFSHWERTLKIANLQERRAGRAFKELRQLQKDRFAAYEVYAELCAMGREVEIPKSLPITELRKSNLQRTNPNYLAQFLLYQTEEVQEAAEQMRKDSEAASKPF
ncbi:hypothetical protein [Bryobacter aggregatus]|uniref:hypothetical protein n=1 Tax=Bryobacter aggregatus TaxID=360054 RepID=UPI0012BADDFF|nr:hypothetical protein [Bryobacter aggregatus]